MKTKNSKDEPKTKSSYSAITAVFILWLLVSGSAIAVVYSSFETRASIHRLEELKKEAATLEVESGQYLLEKSVWTDYARIERVAKEELKMVVPSENQVVVVRKN